MSSKMKMQSALDYMASKLKLESLKLNEKDECYLTFDGEFHVRVTYDDAKDEVSLSSEVGIVEKNSVEAYKKILSENFFWVGTAGSSLLLEDTPSGDLLVLRERVPMSMLDDERFYFRMEDFVNGIEYWHNEFSKLPVGTEAADTSSAPASGPSPFMMGA